MIKNSMGSNRDDIVDIQSPTQDMSLIRSQNYKTEILMSDGRFEF